MSWAIIGLGWLGRALEKTLQDQGIPAWGTQRSSFDFLTQELPSQEHDVLFLNTPPLLGLRAQEYVDKIKTTPAGRIIFISSTSVFGDSQGSVNEASFPQPDTANGLWLTEVEEALRSYFKNRLQIIRPGGLIGGDRHPAKFLSGRKNVPAGLDVVNLIHRDDLISLILAHTPEHSLLHAVSPFHPTREEYYNGWCEKLHLPKIEFRPEAQGLKVVTSLYASQLITWKHEKLDAL